MAMTEELERSRALMAERFGELKAREDNLQITIEESVKIALDQYITNNPPHIPIPAQEVKTVPIASPDVVRDSADLAVHSSQSAIKMICGSSNLLDRLMSQYELPDRYVDDRHEVASAFDFYHRSLKKYSQLNDIFVDATEGAELILAVHKFRDLFSSYKKGLDNELLDWLTLYALANQSEVLHDKVQASLGVACSVKFVDRQILFNDMMASGVLPEIADNLPDILDSIGATELQSADSSCLALKSVCNFVVSYCGHFDDILSRAQDAERSFLKRRYEDTDDCQARFSAEQKEYNLVLVWFGADFMLPIKRAQLFLERCSTHIKKQFAEDSELFVGITWIQFRTRMAKAWNSAVKKRRMMIDMGLDVDKIIPSAFHDIKESPLVPAFSPASTPASGFSADIDDVIIEIQCKEDGCGPFKYSQQKIQWLRDKFGVNFHMPSRCIKHKAIADAERNGTGSPAENPDAPAVPVSNIDAPLKNRFGSRRAPNMIPP